MEYLGHKNIPEDIIGVIDSALAEFRLSDEDASVLLQAWEDRRDLPERVHVVNDFGTIAVDGVVRWIDFRQQPEPPTAA